MSTPESEADQFDNMTKELAKWLEGSEREATEVLLYIRAMKLHDDDPEDYRPDWLPQKEATLLGGLDRVDREYENGPARALTKLLRSVVSRPDDFEWSKEDGYRLAEVIFWRECAAVSDGSGRGSLILQLGYCLEMILKGDYDRGVRDHLEEFPKMVRHVNWA